MRKKLFAILMSAMMMVTFMPAMAFADATHVVNEVKSITWAADKQSATVEFYTDASADKTQTVVATASFDGTNGFGDLTLAKQHIGGGIENDYDFTVDGSTKTLFVTTNALKNLLKVEDVVNMKEAQVTTSLGTAVSAGAYSEALERGLTTYNVTAVKVGSKTLTATDLFTVSYPEYKAYSYDATAKADLKGNLVVTLTAAGKAVLRGALADEIFYMNDSYTKEVTFLTDEAVSTYYKTWGILDSTVETTGIDADDTIKYDGKEHAVGISHPANNVAVTYAFKALGTGATAEADFNKAFVAEDFTLTTAPTIKDANSYKVGMTMVYTKKDGSKVTLTETRVFNVEKLHVTLAQKSAVLKKAYDGKGYQLNAADFKVIETSTDAIVSGESFFAEEELTSANVGQYFIYAQELANAKVSNNYVLDRIIAATANGKMTVEITKATNKVTLKAQTVKKNKTIKATAKLGEVKFKKVSGNKKIKVSKAGKVTVKKGLKKGTYKVKVKAYVSATDNFVGASATKTIKVKVK
ncbi:MAG: hypothetical protein KBS56_02915 [Clostridiales bacterium]|nr:hypothetical protein [Candidatus Crickella equi]